MAYSNGKLTKPTEPIDANENDSYHDAMSSDYPQSVKGLFSKYGKALKEQFNDASPTTVLTDGSHTRLGYSATHNLATELVANSGLYPANRTVSATLTNASNMRLARLSMLTGCNRSLLASRLLEAALEDLDASINPK